MVKSIHQMEMGPIWRDPRKNPFYSAGAGSSELAVRWTAKGDHCELECMGRELALRELESVLRELAVSSRTSHVARKLTLR